MNTQYAAREGGRGGAGRGSERAREGGGRRERVVCTLRNGVEEKRIRYSVVGSVQQGVSCFKKNINL